MALALALELIKAQAFSLLYIAVSLAHGPTSRFKQQLRSLQVTLSSLQRRATAIQRTGGYNLELDLATDEIEELYTQMVKGTSLIGRLSNIRIWNYFCIIRSADQLAELDISLKRLLDYLSLPDHMHIWEMLSLLRKNRDRFRELQRIAQQTQRTLTVIFTGISNTKSTVPVNGGNGCVEAQVMVSLEGVGAALGTAFQELLDVVIEVREKVVIFKPLLGDIKFLMYYLKPLIEEIELLDCYHVELEQFRMEMEKGVKLVRKCLKVCLWTNFNKHHFTNKLVRLDQSLRDKLYMLIVQAARKASKVLDSTRDIEAMVKQLEKSTVTLQNQLEIHPSPTVAVGWEVNKVDVMKETVVSAMSMQEEVKLIETLDSERDIADDIKRIEGSSGVLKKQNENDDEALSDETTETSMPTVGLDKLNLQGSSDEAKETMVDQIGGHVASPSENQNRVTGPLVGWHAEGAGIGTLFMCRTLLQNNIVKLHGVAQLPWPTLKFTPIAFGDKVEDIEANHVWDLLLRQELQPQTRNLIRFWCPALEPSEFIVRLKERLKKMKMKLLEDDISTLLVTASGGMGKTTVAKMLYQHYQGAKFGKNIAFVDTASRRPNYNILQELSRQMGSQVPTFQDKETAFNWLQEFLRESGENPFLLALDNVWPESESFLDKCNEFKRSDDKILVTSRSQFARFRSYHLPTLELEDGMTIFRRLASPPDGSSDIPKDFAKQTVQQFVESYRGFPLAITVVGRSLCGQPITTGEKTVENATSSDLLLLLQSSIDALDKKLAVVKECFSDLGSFPEDRRISVAALVDIWAELNELHELRCVENLNELISPGLVKPVVIRKEKMEADDYYRKQLVTELCDIMHLGVLDITNCHKPFALPQEIRKLGNLQMLSLRSCSKLSELPVSLTNLEKLLCLDVSYCSSIDELPEDIGEMSNLRKIKMNHCPKLRELPGSVHHHDMLQEVICDEDKAYLWEPLSSTLKNLQITVVKED